MPQHFIYATGDTCYDESGITFPVQQEQAVDWDEILSGLKNPAPRWETQYDWLNQPKVLVFSASPDEVRLVIDRVDAHPALKNRVLVMRKEWRSRR